MTRFLTTDLDALVVGDLVVRKHPDAGDRFPDPMPDVASTVEFRTERAAGGPTRHMMTQNHRAAPKLQVAAETYAVLLLADGARACATSRSGRAQPTSTELSRTCGRCGISGWSG